MVKYFQANNRAQKQDGKGYISLRERGKQPPPPLSPVEVKARLNGEKEGLVGFHNLYVLH